MLDMDERLRQVVVRGHLVVDAAEQARAVRHVKQLPDPRHQHQHADKAIDDRRDAREQADRGFHDGAELFGRHFRKEHGRQKPDRHADQDRAAGAVDAREDEGCLLYTSPSPRDS